MSDPDPLIDVLMNTMLFENRETAALLLCRLEDTGYKIVLKTDSYYDYIISK
jgi:hypothetical protein